MAWTRSKKLELANEHNKINKKSAGQDKRKQINDLATKAQVAADTNNLKQLYQITKPPVNKKTKPDHRVKDK